MRRLLLPAIPLLLSVGTGCGVAGTPATSPAEPETTTTTDAQTTTPTETNDPETSGNVSTCKDLVKEVVRISADQKGDQATILQVYKAKKVKDRQAAYAAGDLKVPKGKTQVTVLTCKGTAALSDTTTVKLSFSMSYDINGDAYVAYKEQ